METEQNGIGMTYYGTLLSYSQTNHPHGRARLFAPAGIILGLLLSLVGAEVFVTYCGFSDGCPALKKIAVLPWHAAHLGPNALPLAQLY